MTLLSFLLGLPARENASAAAPIPTINTIRLDNFTTAYGGNRSFNGTPDVVTLITQPIHIYADTTGMVAWVILFSFSFITLWFANDDIRLPGIIGIIMGSYIALFIPSPYMLIGLACIVIAGAAGLWSILQKRA